MSASEFPARPGAVASGSRVGDRGSRVWGEQPPYHGAAEDATVTYTCPPAATLMRRPLAAAIGHCGVYGGEEVAS
jgi:hypothetical protein